MKIIIERSGGLVARNVRVELDAARLTRDQCRALAGLFRATRNPERIERSEEFSFHIVAEGRRSRREVRVGEHAMPPSLSRLLPA
jgi:hypothetical protein